MLVLHSQIEQEHSKKSTLLSELSLQSSEIAHLKAKEMQLVKEVTQLRETKRKIDEDYNKLRNEHRENIVQVWVIHNFASIYGFNCKTKITANTNVESFLVCRIQIKPF